MDRKGGVHLGTVRRGGEYDKNILHKKPKILIKSLLEKKSLIGKVWRKKVCGRDWMLVWAFGCEHRAFSLLTPNIHSLPYYFFLILEHFSNRLIMQPITYLFPCCHLARLCLLPPPTGIFWAPGTVANVFDTCRVGGCCYEQMGPTEKKGEEKGDWGAGQEGAKGEQGLTHLLRPWSCLM